MFVRNGEALGSVQHAEPKVKAPKPQTPEPEDERAESEQVADEQASEELGVPARNASREDWAEFISSKGIEFTEDAGRNDLRDLWDENGGE